MTSEVPKIANDTDDAVKAPRTALRVVAGNPRINMPRREQPADDYGFILPPVNVFFGELREHKKKLVNAALGMTSAQRELAWRIACKEREKFLPYIRAVDYVWRVWNVLEAALDQERREILAILLEHYPAAARRIMRSYQRKPERKSGN
jgi:hypothetical protein